MVLFLIKGVNNTAQYLEAIYLILIPAFIFVVEYIVHLEPYIKSLGHPELGAHVQVKGPVAFKGFSTSPLKASPFFVR